MSAPERPYVELRFNDLGTRSWEAEWWPQRDDVAPENFGEGPLIGYGAVIGDQEYFVPLSAVRWVRREKV